MRPHCLDLSFPPDTVLSTSIVKCLINAGADVNHVGSNEDSVLGSAVGNGHVETAQVLVKSGADPNKPSGRRTPLILAACVQSTDLVDLLLIAAGAEVNAYDYWGVMALTEAAIREDVEILR